MDRFQKTVIVKNKITTSSVDLHGSMPIRTQSKYARTIAKPINNIAARKPKFPSLVINPKPFNRKFNKENIKRLKSIFYGQSNKFVVERNKSYDKITTRPRSQLRLFYKRTNRPRKNKNEQNMNEQPLERKPEVYKSVSNIKRTLSRKENRRGSKLPHELNFNKLPTSSIVPVLRKKPSIEKKLRVVQETQESGQTTIDDTILAYLKRTLSSMITESVYFKDYYSLYKKYQNGCNQRYRYRSKSDPNLKTMFSRRKRQAFDYCLFTDYLYNIYIHYNIRKEIQTNINYIMDKNTIFYTEIDRLNAMNPYTRYGVTKVENSCFFNFFTLNKYLKEFSHSIKVFNQTNQLRYIEIYEPRRSKKIGMAKTPLVTTSMKNEEKEISTNVIQQPVNNLNSANLFQKLVQHTVDKEKQQARKQMFKKKLNNCFKKTLFFLGRRFRKQSKDNSIEINPSRSYATHRKKMPIDISRVYKLPKTMDIKKISGRVAEDFASTNREFKTHNFNISRIDHSMKRLHETSRR